MFDRVDAMTIELRIMYALAFIAIGYALGICYPAIEKWPVLGNKVGEMAEPLLTHH